MNTVKKLTAIWACILAVVLFMENAFAVDIWVEANRTGWTAAETYIQDLNGPLPDDLAGTIGGIARFNVINAAELVGTDAEFLGTEFYAICMEPWETIGTAATVFKFVPASQAPSLYGPMGGQRADWMAAIFDADGYTDIFEIIGAGPSQVAAYQNMVYEIGLDLDHDFDFDSGDVMLGGPGNAREADFIDAIENNENRSVNVWAMINYGPLGSFDPETSQPAVGQDFTTIEEKSPTGQPIAIGSTLVLILLGLTALAIHRRRVRN